MSKNNTPFVMPGADPMDDEGPLLDLNFMDPTDEEVAAREADAARKAELKAQADADAAEEAAKKAPPEDKVDPAAVEAKKDEPTEDEQKLAAEIEADKKAKKQPMVPKSRLDEVLAKNREMAEQLKTERAAREALTPKPEKDATAFDFDAKEGEYMQAVLDGEKDKALTIRKEIRAAEKADSSAQANTDSGRTSEAIALQQAAAEVQKTFPQFAEGSDSYNAEATARVIKMRDALIMQGSNAVEALNEAVEFVVRKYDFDVAIEPTPDTKVVNLDDKRKKDVAKKVDVQKKQPPEVMGEGERTRTPPQNQVDVLSDEEWDALPEATRRRLRGDMI
jgi:hypothetical protein